MDCLNLSDIKIKELVDKYGEITISKAQEHWIEHGFKDFPTDKFIDDFNKLQNKAVIQTDQHSPDVILDTNRLLSKIIIQRINSKDGLLIKDIKEKGSSLQDYCANGLQLAINNGAVDEGRIGLVQNLVEDIRNNTNNIWTNFNKYLDYNFGLKTTNAYDQFVSASDMGELKEDWDNNKIFKEPKENISADLKMKFATIVDESKTSSLGMYNVIDVNDIYNKLVNYHKKDYNGDQAISTLRTLEKDVDLVYGKIADLLEESANRKDRFKNTFLNSYLQATKQNIQQSKITTFKTSEKRVQVGSVVNNRDSFPERALWDKLQNSITSKIENKLIDNNSLLFTKPKDVKEDQYVFDTLNRLGIPVSKSFINNIYSDYTLKSAIGKGGETVFNKVQELLYSKDKLLDKLKGDINKFSKSNKSIKELNIKGYLQELISTIKPGLNTLPEYGYQNVVGKIQYSVQQTCHVTDLFREFDNSNRQAILDRFEKFTKAPHLKYSNWLWKQTEDDSHGIFRPITNPDGIPKLFGFDEKGRETNENPTYYNYKIDENAIDSNGVAGVDLAYLNQFDISKSEGQKNLSHNKGKEYDELIGYTWDLNTISNYLIGNEKEGHTINRYNMMLPSSDSGGTYSLLTPKHNVEFELKKDDINNTYILSFNNITKLRNIVHQELDEMFIARDMIFDKNKLFPSDGSIGKFVRGAGITDDMLHSVKHGDYVGDKFRTDHNNRPTGKVFDPRNITYIEKGKLITLKSYFKDNYGQEIELWSRKKVEEMQPKIDEFITTALENKVNQFLNYTKPLQSTLFLLRKYGNDSNVEFNELKGKDKVEKLNTALTSFYLDNFINYAEFGNLIYGTPSEYKDILEWNKRVNQVIRPGLQHFSDRSTRVLTVNDIKLESKIPTLLGNVLSPERLKQYSKNVNVADGFSVITLQEYKSRLTEAGRYEKYDNIIQKLEKGQPFNANEFNKFIESQKYFMYSRQDMKGIPTLSSYQFKNSTMVLVPEFIKGTEWEDINKFMDQVGADQINFKSATKLGGVHTINIHDKQGNLKLPEDIDSVKNIITEHPMSNLYIQQDIPTHNVDTENKISTQMMKNIITNLDHTDNTKYVINGKEHTGKEIEKLWHENLGSNIMDSADELFTKLDAIDENGELKQDTYGNILVNKEKILDTIRNYMDTSTDNANILTALEGDITDSNVPFFASVNTPKFMQIVLSQLTKNIVDQKLPGGSLVLIPDIFNKPSIRFFNGTAPLEDYFNNSRFSYTKEFRDRHFNADGTPNGTKFELRPISEYDEKTGIAKNGYEAIINPFISGLISKDGKIDISQFSDDALEMIGTRIPNEGKQSAVFLKVVGFMNTGSSQIILPYDLVNTTGWDFDIDKIFLYNKHLEYKDGKYQPINNTNVSKQEKYINFIKSRSNDITYKDIINKLPEGNLQKVVDYINDMGDVTSIVDRDKIPTNLKSIIDKYINDNKLFLSDDLNIDLSTIPSKLDNPYKLIFELKKAIDAKLLPDEKNLAIKAQGLEFTKNFNDFIDLFFPESIGKDDLNIAKSIASLHGFQNEESFYKKPANQQLDRETRDNHIIETMKSIMRSKYNADEVLKQNELKHVKAASNYVNDKAGFKINDYNQNDYTENSKLRSLNVQTRNLKDISVATDGVINILSTLKAHFNLRDYPEIKIHEKHVKLNGDELKEIFGKPLVSENGYYYIKDNFIGNNASGTWKDSSRQTHSNQLSEVTTNIFDAVKELMFHNLDKNTIGVFKTMTMGSLLHRDDITGAWKKDDTYSENEYNRYLYSTLFLSQPVIKDYIKTMNFAITYEPKESTINNKVLGEYYKDFYSRIWNKDIKARVPELSADGKSVEWSQPKDINGSKLINEIINKKMNAASKNALISDISKGNDIELWGKGYNHFELYDHLKTALSINNKYHTLERLNKDFSDYYKNNEAFDNPEQISNQIEVFNTFKEYNNLSKAITKAVSTLNTDKQSIGPNITTTRKIFNNILNSVFTPQELREKLYDLKTELEYKGDFKSLTNDTIAEYFRQFTSGKDTMSKYDTLNQINENLPEGYIINDPSTMIQIGKDSIYKLIYPSVFRIKKKSVYPILEHYLIDGHKRAYDMLAEINIFESNRSRELKDVIGNKLYGTDVEYLDKEINHSILRSAANTFSYFKNSENEIPRIFGIEKENVDLKSIDINDVSHLDENVEKFNKLSLCDKIEVLLNDPKMIKYIRDPRFKTAHILDNINLEHTQEQIKKNGIERIEYINNDTSQNMQIFSMLDTYNNSNPFLASVGSDLVKYSFFKDGFKYGNNLAKIIPSELYFYSKEEKEFMNDVRFRKDNNEPVTPEEEQRYVNLQENSPKQYSDLMKGKLVEYNTNIYDNLNQENVLNSEKAFHQQNKFNETINPRVYTKESSQWPNFKLWNIKESEIRTGSLSNKNFSIFVEDASKVDKSFTGRNDFVTYKDDGKVRLFTRQLEEINTGKKKTNIYVYYPIDGTLPGEVLHTNIKDWQEHPEHEYQDFIKLLKSTHKLDAIFNGAYTHDESFSSQVAALYDTKSDYIRERLPVIDIEDEEGNTKAISETLNKEAEETLNKYLKYHNVYNDEYNTDTITIKDRLIDGKFSREFAKVIFEFAKSDDKNIYLKDINPKGNKIYHYDSALDSFVEYDNSAPISHNLDDILYYMSYKYGGNKANKLLWLLDTKVTPKLKGETIVDYVSKHRDELLDITNNDKTVVDLIPELAKTNFFKDINLFRSLDEKHDINIKYSKGLTTITSKSTNSDVSNALHTLSDVTINIGDRNSIEYKAIEGKDKLVDIDYTHSIDGNASKILDKLRDHKLNSILIGVLGETKGKSQEFYNEYVNTLLNKVSDDTNKPIILVTLDKTGVYQSALLNKDYDKVVLDNLNNFEEKHNDNIKYSRDLNPEILEDVEKEEIEDTNGIISRKTTMVGLQKGLYNVMAVKNELFTSKEKAYEIFAYTSSELLSKRTIDDIKKDNATSAKIGSDALVNTTTVTKNVIKSINKDFSKVDLNDLFKTENNKKRMEIAKKMQLAGTMIRSLDYISDLVEFEIPKDENHIKDLEDVNDNIIHLKNIRNDILKDYNKTRMFINKFFAQTLYEHSKNPGVVRTKFNEFKKQAQASIFGEEYRAKELSDHDVAQMIADMYSTGRDISWATKMFDSPFNTGVPFFDASLLEYFDQHEQMVTDRNKYKDKLEEILTEFYNDKKTATSNKDVYYHKRLRDFVKYIKDNEIVSETKWSDFKKNYWDTKWKIYDLEREHDATDSQSEKSLIEQRIRNLHDRWLRDNVEGVDINEEKNKAGLINVSGIKFDDSIKIDQVKSKELNQQKHLYPENNRYLNYLLTNELHKLNTRYYKNSDAEFIKLVPKKSKYANLDYEKFSDKEKKMLTDMNSLINNINSENVNEYTFHNNFFPKILEPSTEEAIRAISGFGRIIKKEDNFREGVNEEEKYIIKMPHIRNFEFYNKFNIPNKYRNETAKEHEIRTLKAANNMFKQFKETKQAFVKEKIGENGFTSIKNVHEYNRYVREYNSKETALRTIKDPYIALATYIDDATNYKFVNNFYDYSEEIIQAATENLKLTKANDLQSYLKSKISGTRENKSINYVDSNIAETMRIVQSNLLGGSKINNRIDQIYNVIYRYTSTTYMAVGIMNGFKNVFTGYNMNISEALGDQFFNIEQLSKASAEYIKLIPQLLSEMGDEKSTNLKIAIWKASPEIFEDTSEMEHLKNFPNTAGKIKWAYDASYYINNADEHFMQYSVYDANLESHRVYEGKVFSKHDFIDGNTRRAIEAHLTPEEKDKLNKYIETRKKSQKHNIEEHSYITEWVHQHQDDLENRFKDIKHTIKELNKTSVEAFEKLPTLASQFELVNGRAELKKDSQVTKNEFVQFKRKSQVISQYLQGVYNRMDRNSIRQTTLTMGLMQFRQWMYPNFKRYYGNSTFNEALGIYQKGTYSTLFNLLVTPIKNRKYINDEGEHIKKGWANLTRDYLNYVKHLKLHYAVMDENSKAKVKMALANFAQIAGLTLSTALILSIAGNTDKEQRDEINQNKLLATLMYYTYSVNSELNQMLPTQLYSTLKKFQQNINATESVIGDLIKLGKTSVEYPFSSDEENTYHTGIYRGEDKLKIEFEKVFPIARQINKWEYIQSYMNWYKQYALRWY